MYTRLRRANVRMVGKLAVVAAGMFAFGYALVPLYRAICEMTGINVLARSELEVPGGAKGQQSSLRRHLLALDRKTGKILWNTPVAAKLPEQESIRDSHGYASSTPAADAERVYCFFGKSGVFAFDHNGKQVWQRDVGDRLHGWGSATSPLLHGDLVFVNASVESESLFALDKKTGKALWGGGDDQAPVGHDTASAVSVATDAARLSRAATIAPMARIAGAASPTRCTSAATAPSVEMTMRSSGRVAEAITAAAVSAARPPCISAAAMRSMLCMAM